MAETHYGGSHTDAGIATTDVTTNDVSITKHGFAPRAPNNTTTFLRGDATWAAPAAIEDFIPAFAGNLLGTVGNMSNNGYGDYASVQAANAADQGIHLSGRFQRTPTAIYVVVVAPNTGNIAWYTTSMFAALGEAYNLNTDAQGTAASPSTTAVVGDQIAQIDVTGSFTGAASGDLFGLVFNRVANHASDTSEGSMALLGLRVVY